jgi:hypothetical protein
MSSTKQGKLTTWSPLCEAKVLDFGAGNLSVVFFDVIRSSTLSVDSTPLFFLIFFSFFTAVEDREFSCKVDVQKCVKFGTYRQVFFKGHITIK